MSAEHLLRAAIEAHGGADRWEDIDELVIKARSGGFALASKARRHSFASITARVSTREPHVEFPEWPGPGRRGVFAGDSVRVEAADGAVLAERRDPRAAFRGRRNLWWDDLDLLYFGGYAWWGYGNAPFLFARPGFEVREGDPWRERGETWRRLVVTFPPDVPAHSRQQVFYFDEAGRLRRNDYTAEVFGRWAHGAHYCHEHRAFDGILAATRRRVYLRGPGNRPLPFPTLIWLDVESVQAVGAAPAP